MEKKEIEILRSDIEVPEVVLEKADAAFARIRKERAKEMENKERGKKIRRYVRPAVAAAACALLFAGIGTAGHMGKSGEGIVAGTKAVPEETQAPEGTVQAPENWFTMTAYAKELQPGEPVPLAGVGDSGRTYVLGGDEADGSVNYCIGTDFLCQGENIERISYSINRGAFQIVQPVDRDGSIIVDGQAFLGELNTGMIGGSYEEGADEGTESYECALYQSFSLDYEAQSLDGTWINICNECPDSGELIDLIWGEGKTLEEVSEGINRMLDDTVITCTVYYADGTSQSVDIAVSSRVMTYEEAGEPAGAGEIPQDAENVFIMFEVK